MKSYLNLIAALSFAIGGVAHAHAHLEKSQPASNSTVAVAPKNVVLEFNEAVLVTALTLQMGDGPAQDLGPLPKAAAKELSVPMPTVAAGSYIVKWRAMGKDNHVMSGKLLFKIGPSDAAATKP